MTIVAMNLVGIAKGAISNRTLDLGVPGTVTKPRGSSVFPDGAFEELPRAPRGDPVK